MSLQEEEKRHSQSIRLPDTSGIDLRRIYAKKPNAEPDFIPYDEKGRDIYGRLAFNTGTSWLSGFILGGLKGTVEGLRNVPNASWRMRANGVLNGISNHGSKTGSVLGVVAFLLTGFSGLADELDLPRLTGTPMSVPLSAGFLTGVLYKSSTGIRGAMLAGTLGSVGSLALSFGYGELRKQFFKKGRF